jgi:O-antigen ligase
VRGLMRGWPSASFASRPLDLRESLDSCDRGKLTSSAAPVDTLPARLRRALLVAAGIYLALLPTGWATAARSIAFGVSAALALLVLALSRSGRGESIPSPGSAILLALLIWSGCAVASASWSVHLAYTLGEFRHELAWGLLTMVIFYIAARDREAWRALVAVALMSFALLAALAAAFAASRAGWDAARWHAGVSAFSTFLVLVAPLLITLLAPAPIGFGAGRQTLAIATALLALLLVAARLSDNRMVWIALAAVFATASALAALRWRATLARAPLRWLAPLVALFLVLGLLFADVAQERARLSFPAETSIAQTFAEDPRLRLWDFTAARIRERPWTGYGFGKWILQDELRLALHDPILAHAHNLFASQWLQIGVFGLAAFIALLAALGWRFIGFLRARDDALALIGLIGLAMLVGFLVKNLTDDFLVRSNAKEFWALCAMLLGYGVRLERAIDARGGVLLS